MANEFKVRKGLLIGTESADDSALIKADSTTQGFLGAPRMTIAQRDAISSPATGLLVYNTDTGAYNFYDGSGWQEVGAGSGAGGVNYITNPDFENDTLNAAPADWNLFNDGATLVDGTGGTVDADLEATSQTTIKLRGDQALRVINNAAVPLGHGISTDFTIDNADKAKVLRISFDYITNTFDDGDIQVYIYDKTNNNLIEPTVRDLPAGGATFGPQVARYISEFQTAPDSTEYRLIFYNTVAWSGSLYLDNVSVGPRDIATGVPVTDWESYTPTISISTNITGTSGRWRRVGDTMEVEALIDIAGASDAAVLTVAIPSGHTIDTAKLTGGSSVSTDRSSLGYARIIDGGGYHLGRVAYASNTTVSILGDDGLGAWTGQSASSVTIGAGDDITLRFVVPISGWSSNTAQSTDFSNRIIAATLTRGSQSIPDSTNTPIEFNSATFDTTGSYDFTADEFVCPEAGFYSVSANVSFGANSTGNRLLAIFKNGSQVFSNNEAARSSFEHDIGVSGLLECEKGDTIEAIVNQTSGSPLSIVADGSQNYMSVHKIQSPQSLFGGESVFMHATRSSSGFSYTSSGDVFEYDTTVSDSHAGFDGVDEYTVPQTGGYVVSAGFTDTGTAFVSGERVILDVRVNGTIVERIYGIDVTAAGQDILATGTSGRIQCNKGDVISILIDSDRAGSTGTNSAQNFLKIHKV